MDEVRGESLQAPRTAATLLGIFALLPLTITAAGLGGGRLGPEEQEAISG